MAISHDRQDTQIAALGYGRTAAAADDDISTKALIEGTEDKDVLNGTDGDDAIHGLGGDDVLAGLGGDDTILGGSGWDTLDGGDGNDWLDAGFDDEWDEDTLYGRGGDDVLMGGYGHDRLYGGEGDDVLIGGHAEPDPNDMSGRSDGDDLFGGAGNDTLVGSAIGDRLYGGYGDDMLLGGNGLDRLFGDPGADLIDGGNGAIDSVEYRSSDAGVLVDLAAGLGRGGFAEGDVIRNIEMVEGSNFADTVLGNGADNRLNGNEGNDILNGRGGDDDLKGAEGDDILQGGDGDDHLTGGIGIDRFDGGAGTDTVEFDSHMDAPEGVTVDLSAETAFGGEAGTGEIISNIENITATIFDDVLTGDGKDNVFEVGGGADRIDTGDGTDTVIFSGSGSVFATGLIISLTTGTVSGGNSDGSTFTNVENVTGGFGRDFIYGDNGDNVLSGSDGADDIFGGGGNDTIIGGMGTYFTENFAPAGSIPGIPPNDSLTGGAGADVFVFNALYDSDIPRADVIRDFNVTEGDRIDLSDFHSTYAGSGEPMDLTFIGYGNFSGQAGEVRFVHDTDSTDLQIDVNGDSMADFLVSLAGVTETIEADSIDF
ncbi:MAG: calcium-binding protein [Phyllobacterium sp.]